MSSSARHTLWLDCQGQILNSQGNLLQGRRLIGTSACQISKLVESIFDHIKTQPLPLKFAAVSVQSQPLNGIFDFFFDAIVHNNNVVILWHIVDRTHHYRKLARIQQRNYEQHLAKK